MFFGKLVKRSFGVFLDFFRQPCQAAQDTKIFPVHLILLLNTYIFCCKTLKNTGLLRQNIATLEPRKIPNACKTFVAKNILVENPYFYIL